MEFQNKCNPELSVQGNNRQKTFFDDNNDENDLSSQDNFSLCSEEKLRLSSWGLPEKVLEFYKSKGITHMFQWQVCSS